MNDLEMTKHKFSSDYDQPVTDMQLLKSRTKNFLNPKCCKLLFEHGCLPDHIDYCLALGVLRFGYDEDEALSEISDIVFLAFSKCLVVRMENQPSREQCDICDSITDLARHSVTCDVGHPEVCGMCQSFFNIIERHLLTCGGCDMHLCIKLKLKLLKYNLLLDNGELVHLWPKILGYVSRLFPDVNMPFRPVKLPKPPTPTATMEELPIEKSYVDLDTFRQSNQPSSLDRPATRVAMVARGLVARGPSPDCAAATAVQSSADESFNYSDFAMKNSSSMSFHSQPTEAEDLTFQPNFPENRRLSLKDGYGSVIMGEPRQLRQLSEVWTSMKSHLGLDPSGSGFPTQGEGVVLNGKSSGLTVLNGAYNKNEQWLKISFLGKGVAGKCYLAVDATTGAKFCVKRIHLSKYQSEELDIWSQLEHPNLVQLYGATRVKCKVYIFCELYASENLANLIYEHQMLDQWRSLDFLQQLLDALAYLKTKGILHEDIKADNILLKPDSFKIGLGDFGLSRKGKCPPNTHPVGGPQQWSPEKARSEGHSHPSDLWAVYCTFIHMLSGSPVWLKRFGDIRFLHVKIGLESPPLADIPDGLIPCVREMVEKAWALDPDQRPEPNQMLQDESFDLLFENPHDEKFTSHFDLECYSPTEVIPGGAEMSFGEESQDSRLSLDPILQTFDNVDQGEAACYLHEVIKSIGYLGEMDSDKSTATSPTLSAGSKRQASINPYMLDSISEDHELSITRPVKDLSVRPKGSKMMKLVIQKPGISAEGREKRESFGRSPTSPVYSSPSQDFAVPRKSLHKQGSSPAIMVTPTPTEEELVQRLLEPTSIYDLSSHRHSGATGGSSGYATQTGPTSTLEDDNSMSMSLLINSPPDSNGAAKQASPPESSLDLGLEDYVSQTEFNTISGYTYNNQQTRSARNGDRRDDLATRMHHIKLTGDHNAQPISDTNGAIGGGSSGTSFILSTLGTMGTSLSSQPKPEEEIDDGLPIITIVNGLTNLDDTDIKIHGEETWRDVLLANLSTLSDWGMDTYAIYSKDDTQVTLDHPALPKADGENCFYAKPCSQAAATWCVTGGTICVGT